MDEQLKSYRNHLINAEQKAQEDFDKTVLSLSGGALGVTFVFLKDIIGIGPVLHRGYLFSAWICWGMSITFILFSYLASTFTLRRTIDQIDSGKIYAEHPGGRLDHITAILNILGGVLFLVGVITMATFVWHNLETINVKPK